LIEVGILPFAVTSVTPPILNNTPAADDITTRGVENGSMKGDTFTRSDPDRDDINYLSTK
jgi:hypothetical protein